MSIKKALATVTVLSSILMTPAIAGETWDSVKQAASNVANKTREVATDVADRTREVAGDAVDRSKEVGEDISESAAWKKTKEIGGQAADATKRGADKVKGYFNENACDKADKLNCDTE